MCPVLKVRSSSGVEYQIMPQFVVSTSNCLNVVHLTLLKVHFLDVLLYALSYQVRAPSAFSIWARLC